MSIKQIRSIYNEKLKTTSKVTRDCFEFLYSKLLVQNIALVGLRQIGKSTLAEQLTLKYYEEQVTDKKTYEDDIYYINVASVSKDMLGTISDTLQIDISINKFKIVLIDEVQLIPRWTNILQSLIDLNKNTKFILTGSSAAHLIEQIAVNRFFTYMVNPLTFNDFQLLWSQKSFEDYLLFGSYPPINDRNIVSAQYLETIRQNVIDKVIYDESLIKVDVDKFYKTMNDIKNYIGNEVNKLDISNSVKISRNTLYDYLSLMINSRLIQKISNIEDKNKIQKYKVYLNDKSMITYLSGTNNLNNNDYGALIENLVFNYLDDVYNPRMYDHNIYYFKDKTEIDFIIPAEKLIIEVKYRTSNINWVQYCQSLNDNIPAKYKDFEKVIITKDVEENIYGWKLIPLIKWLTLMRKK